MEYRDGFYITYFRSDNHFLRFKLACQPLKLEKISRRAPECWSVFKKLWVIRNNKTDSNINQTHSLRNILKDVDTNRGIGSRLFINWFSITEADPSVTAARRELEARLASVKLPRLKKNFKSVGYLWWYRGHNG